MAADQQLGGFLLHVWMAYVGLRFSNRGIALKYSHWYIPQMKVVLEKGTSFQSPQETLRISNIKKSKIPSIQEIKAH